jgi:predicted NBD/HSP70 family sugar kinase
MEKLDGKILSLLFKQGPLSNQEIAVELSNSPSTITSATTRLLKIGAISLIGAIHFNSQINNGQRRKRTYQLNPEFGYGIMINIDNNSLTVHLNRFDLSHISSYRIPITHSNRDVILKTISNELPKAISARTGDRLLGIGFSMPGQVDTVGQKAIHNTRIEGWENVSFDRYKVFSDNINVENVANAITIGEHIGGSAKAVEDVLLLHVGNGAGMGIMINGKLHRGHNHAAGEAGHVIIEESSGTICICGNRGCLESFISCRAVITSLDKLKRSDVPSGILSDPSLKDGLEVYRLLCKYYESGDKVAYLVIEELAHKLGLAIVNFAQVLDPERIVISGAIRDLGEQFLKLVQQNVTRYHLPWLAQVPIVYGLDDNVSAARGAAFLVFEKLWE